LHAMAACWSTGLRLGCMPIDPDILLRGALTYLRHSRRFQQDAVNLYEQQRFSAAVVLSTISLEHTSTATWLYDSSKAPEFLASATPHDLSKLLTGKHNKIIARGLRTFSYIRNAKRVEELIAKINADALSDDENAVLYEEHQQIMSDELKTFPGDIHRLRTAAQYVDFDAHTNEWSIADIKRQEAELTVITAGNSYGWLVNGQLRVDHRALSLSAHLGIHDEIFDLRRNWPTAQVPKVDPL
jgi:AbiV family abortive infection protein